MAEFIPCEDAVRIMVDADISVAHQQNDYLKKYSRMIKLLLGTNGDPLFERKIKKHFKILGEAIWAQSVTHYSLEMKDCLLSYLAAGNVEFIKWWTANAGKYSDEEFTHMLNLLMVDTSKLLSSRC